MESCFYCGNEPSRYYRDIYGLICCDFHLEKDLTVGRCFECSRLTVKSGHILKDGRILCDVCKKLAVSTDKPFDWMLEEVMLRFKKVGFGHIKTSGITIYSATPQEMAAYKKEEINIYNGGFCRLMSNGTIDIYVQSHQTKIHFAGTLAHELMHAWCFQHNIMNMSDQWCEGLCNLMSYYVYSTIDYPLARYYEKCLFENDDPIYGEGFRIVHQYWKEHGWSGLKQYVKSFVE